MSKAINITGLAPKSSKAMAEGLNHLLASYQILYTNVRGYHWNIRGPHFFELHAKFESIYNVLLDQLDEIAERVLTLGHTPDHALSDYLKNSRVPEHSNANSHKDCVTGILGALQTIMNQQRDMIELADQNNDERTHDLLNSYLLEQEKLAWMLQAYLS